MHKGQPAWRSISFVASTGDILARCMREGGCPPADAERLLAGLPPTFEEWAKARVQTCIETIRRGSLRPRRPRHSPLAACKRRSGGPCWRPRRPGAAAMTAPPVYQAREPAEHDPGPGWLRSRFLERRYPRSGVAPCGRPSCPVCAPAAPKSPESIPERPTLVRGGAA